MNGEKEMKKVEFNVFDVGDLVWCIKGTRLRFHCTTCNKWDVETIKKYSVEQLELSFY